MSIVELWLPSGPLVAPERTTVSFVFISFQPKVAAFGERCGLAQRLSCRQGVDPLRIAFVKASDS